jgi:hypothetical protein
MLTEYRCSHLSPSGKDKVIPKRDLARVGAPFLPPESGFWPRGGEVVPCLSRVVTFEESLLDDVELVPVAIDPPVRPLLARAPSEETEPVGRSESTGRARTLAISPRRDAVSL